MADMDFAAGSMLTVERGGEIDPHGDSEYFFTHEIGPCDVPQTSSTTPSSDEAGRRVVSAIQVRGPVDSDIRKSDRVRLPNGVLCTVSSEPSIPKNPFTGWSPFIYFNLTAVT